MGCYAEGYDTAFGRRIRVRNECTDKIVSTGIDDFKTANYKISQGYFDPACDCPEPPGGVYRKCASHTSIAVWNQKKGEYDVATCSTGKCQDGNCVKKEDVPNYEEPPGGVQRKCVSDTRIAVWNQKTGQYDEAECSTHNCSEGMCISKDEGEEQEGCKYGTTARFGQGIDPSIFDIFSMGASCPDGYFADIVDPGNPLLFQPPYGACICNSASEEERDKIMQQGRKNYKEQKELTPGMFAGLADIIKMLPQLLILMIVISLIGAFRK